MDHPNRDLQATADQQNQYLTEHKVPLTATQQPLYEALGLPHSLWWPLCSTISCEKDANHQWLNVTLGADVFKAVLAGEGGVQTWSNLMEYWKKQDYFLLRHDPTKDPEPLIYLTLDFADADFTNLFLDCIDLRFAWLNRANFAGASLECAMFDCSYISATNFSNAQMVGASFLYCLHHPKHPPFGLSQELIKHYGIAVDPEIPFE